MNILITIKLECFQQLGGHISKYRKTAFRKLNSWLYVKNKLTMIHPIDSPGPSYYTGLKIHSSHVITTKPEVW